MTPIQNHVTFQIKMSVLGIDFKAPLREVKKVQFGILSPDEIVSVFNALFRTIFIP